MKMTTMRRGLSVLVFAGAAALAAGGCEDDTKYSYVAVKVTFNDQATADYLGKVNCVGVNVGGADFDSAPLGCWAGRLASRELGTFEWSSLLKSGTVTFQVVVNDMAGMEIGRGESAPVNLVPDQMVPGQVVVVPDPKALIPK
jgi:hypothetical protein